MKLKNWEVYRVGKCITCGLKSKILIGEVEIETEKEAIELAIEYWEYNNFGQGGALRPKDVAQENQFLNADFEAKEII